MTMTLEQTATVLAKIATFDNRRVDQATIAAWHDAIGHIKFEYAMQAVSLFRRESTEYMQPAHLVVCARRIATERMREIAEMRGVSDVHRPAPKPDNFDAMAAAWDDPIEFARQVAIYDEQLRKAGFTPVVDQYTGGRR